jgi:hypothetical protein
MLHSKPNVARKIADVLTTVMVGIAFFFAIIGVFGLGRWKSRFCARCGMAVELAG